MNVVCTQGGNSSSNNDDDHSSTVVICDSKDEFVLQQDICYSCGSFGQGEEGKLVVCSQCGQCYHPYCANIKVNVTFLLRYYCKMYCYYAHFFHLNIINFSENTNLFWANLQFKSEICTKTWTKKTFYLCSSLSYAYQIRNKHDTLW